MLLITLLTLALNAHASTDPRLVDQIDQEREGQLKELVIAKTAFAPCEDFAVAKTEAFKLASSSVNVTKKPGTPYEYEATYLVVHKCLYGSTFMGTYVDTQRSLLVKGSFKANYAAPGSFRPAKLRNLKIEVLKEISETNANL